MLVEPSPWVQSSGFLKGLVGFIRPPLNLVDSSDFLPLIFMGWDIPGEHPEPLKNNIEFLVFSHFSFIFWCWLLYLGHWAENQ